MSNRLVHRPVRHPRGFRARPRRALYALPLAALLLAAGCAEGPLAGPSEADGPDPFGPDGQPNEATRLVLQVTDGPAPPGLFASATVHIGRVQGIPKGGPPILLAEEGGEFDLLQLRDGVTALLADLELEPTALLQLRLEVLSAEVELAEGHSFADGTSLKSLRVPSGWIKVNLAPLGDGDELEAEELGDENGEEGEEVEETSEDEESEEGEEGEEDEEEENPDAEGLLLAAGSETTLVLDFDVGRNFVIQGNPYTPAGIKGVLFTPLVRVGLGGEDAGSISGTVLGPEESVQGLTVTAEPEEGEENGELGTEQTEAVTAETRADGTYTLHFLGAGTWRVTVAAPEGYLTDPAERSVTLEAGEDATGVDFELVEDGEGAETESEEEGEENGEEGEEEEGGEEG